MSDAMLLGVLRMPLDMALASPLSTAQFHNRAREAADRIARDADLIDDLVEALRLCYDHCRLYHPEVERNNVGEAVRTALAKATGEA